MKIPETYISKIKNRSNKRYYLGLIVRLKLRIRYNFINWIARKKGAQIGKDSIIPYNLAKNANKNLIVGNDVIIETDKLDLRSPIIIKDHVIINKDVTILRVSHQIDNDNCFTTRYYPSLIIESYSWLCTGCHIMPSVTKIDKGSVISGYSILFKDTIPDEVIGVDGKVLRKHNTRFTELVVCSLKGGDYNYYRLAKNQ